MAADIRRRPTRRQLEVLRAYIAIGSIAAAAHELDIAEPTARRQLEVLRAYIRAGSIAAAAFELGISETTARQHLSGLYRRYGLPERGTGRVPARLGGAGSRGAGNQDRSVRRQSVILRS